MEPFYLDEEVSMINQLLVTEEQQKFVLTYYPEFENRSALLIEYFYKLAVYNERKFGRTPRRSQNDKDHKMCDALKIEVRCSPKKKGNLGASKVIVSKKEGAHEDYFEDKSATWSEHVDSTASISDSDDDKDLEFDDKLCEI